MYCECVRESRKGSGLMFLVNTDIGRDVQFFIVERISLEFSLCFIRGVQKC